MQINQQQPTNNDNNNTIQNNRTKTITNLKTSLNNNENITTQHLINTNLNQMEYIPYYNDNNEHEQHETIQVQRKYQYLIDGMNSLIDILYNEPWWEETFRIFQHRCGNGIFIMQLLLRIFLMQYKFWAGLLPVIHAVRYLYYRNVP